MDNNYPNNNQNDINNYINQNEEENKDIYQILLNKLNKNKNNNNNIQQENLKNYEENQVDEEEEYEEVEDTNKNKIVEKNFSQQVDFLYHPNDPENQSSIKNILIKQYKKQKKLIQKEDSSKNAINKNKKSKKSNKMIKKQAIPYLNKNKGLFDPYLTEKELDYESKIKKQREEKQKKIAEYEKNKSRKKLEEDINKRILNYAKPKVGPLIKAKNYAQKKVNRNDEDLIKHFVKIPKPKVQKKLAQNFGFDPKKYDAIINSLLNEINEVKKERKRENEMFKKQIQLYTKDNVDKYNNYYEFIYKKQKLNYENNRSKNRKNKNNTKPTRGQIINGLMKQYFGKDNQKCNQIKENNIINDINLNNKSNEDIYEKKINEKNNNDKGKIMKNNYINNINNLLINNQENISKMNFDNIDKLLSSENLSFQNKINILIELNKNLDNYYKDMPSYTSKVQASLNKLFENENDPNNFRKEANKIPYIAMASRSAYQIIQANNDQIIEKIIDELLYECTFDLNIIDEKKQKLFQKQQLINELDKVKNNINDIIPKAEEDIYEKLNSYLQKKEEKLNNDIINNKRNKIEIIKFRSILDENFISERNKNKDEFREYMVFKGSFYHKDIFNIYDEFVEEEGDNILNKIVNNYIDELHRQAQKMTNNEINNIEGK